MPGLAVRISASGECIGKGQVDAPSLRVGGSLVDGRADQRVTDAHRGCVGDQEAGPQGALEVIVGGPDLVAARLMTSSSPVSSAAATSSHI